MPGAETFLAAKPTQGNGKVRPVMAVIGEEEYLRRQVVTGIIQRVEAEHGPADLQSYDGDSADLATVLDDVRARTLFGGVRIVVLYDNGGRKSFLDKHKDALASFVPGAGKKAGGVLVLVAAKMNKGWRLAKAIGANPDSGLRIDCDPPQARELPQWLIARAADRNLDLDADTAAAFVETAGTSLSNLVSELDKLDLYLTDAPATGRNGRRVLDRATLRDTLGFEGTTEVWSLLNHMTDGDLPASLDATERLLRKGESPYRLNALVLNQIKTMWRGAALMEQGLSARDAASEAGGRIPPQRKRQLESTLHRMRVPACRRMLEELADVDRKANPLEVDRAFEFFVARICKEMAATKR